MMRAAAGSLLAQVRPDGTSAVELYAAPDELAIEVTQLVVCNVSGSTLTCNVCHDDAGGSTFNQTTALYWTRSLAAGETLRLVWEIGSGLQLSPGGQIGVTTSVADGITFSLYGVSQETAPL